jgi:immune inhibitor A
MLEQVRSADPPGRDLVALHQRIQTGAATPVLERGEGFWINDLANRSFSLVQADLHLSTAHADWYVERGRDPGNLLAASDFFEQRTFPEVTALTGVDWTPGAGGQARLAIFNGRTPGVSGYMSANDVLPRTVFSYSNERLTIYLSGQIGSSGYNGTLAHELEHLAHFVVNPNQQGWLDEGLAELVSNLVNGGPPAEASAYRGHPDVQLNAWTPTPSGARAHYDASMLWVRYLMERGGDPSSLRTLIQAGGQGFETIERYAAAEGWAGGFTSLFVDWLVANGLGDATRDGGRYGYQGSDRRVELTGQLIVGADPVTETVHQYAADYFGLDPTASGELHVAASPTVPFFDAPGDGAVFWSARADNVDTRLTHQFDLSAVANATLRYRVWHDIETDYDFCYTLASPDGTSWAPLSGRWTTDRDAVGASLGPGYTGTSGATADWLDEEIDLTPYAGHSVAIRFECVTDQSYSGPGFAVDDIAIPEIGFFDDAESNRGWLAEGFVRGPNQMSQPAVALLVEITNQDVRRREVPLDGDGVGTLLVEADSDVQRRLVIVAGLAPVTLSEMPYRVWITARSS